MAPTGTPTDHGIQRPLRRFAWIVVALLLIVAIGLAVLFVVRGGRVVSTLLGLDANHGLQPALFQTAPLRTTQNGVDRVYVVSTQQQTLRFRGGRSISEARTDYLHIDLWAINAATATVAWRRRLHSFKDDEIGGRILPGFAILGADGETLWLNVEGPLGVSLADGHVIADHARIEQRNPKLAGMRVLEPGYVAFGRTGLQVTLNDASQWRIDARDLSAAPRDTPVGDPAGIVAIAERASDNSRFQIRSLTAGQSWLGVLTDTEADALSHPPVIPGSDPTERPGVMQRFLAENHVPQALNEPLLQPYRLWKAQVKQVSAAPPDWPKSLPDNWGSRAEFSAYNVLPESPIFLQAGLLRDGSSSKAALWYRNPDSILVLHMDKLGGAGRLQLTRVSGPLGKPVWQVPLPMTALASVMRGTKDLVLFGRGSLPNDGQSDDDHPQHHQLVRIDVAGGKSIALDLTAASISQAPTPAEGVQSD